MQTVSEARRRKSAVHADEGPYMAFDGDLEGL